MLYSSLQWRHNEPDRVSNHRPHDCLLNLLFRRRSKKLRLTGLSEGNSPVTGWFPAQRASYAENVSIYDDVIMNIMAADGLTTIEANHLEQWCWRNLSGSIQSPLHSPYIKLVMRIIDEQAVEEAIAWLGYVNGDALALLWRPCSIYVVDKNGGLTDRQNLASIYNDMQYIEYIKTPIYSELRLFRCLS